MDEFKIEYLDPGLFGGSDQSERLVRTEKL
jgi:hypothetical protein